MDITVHVKSNMIHGNSLEEIPKLNCKIDAVLADPPYGVGCDYDDIIDDEALVMRSCVPIIEVCRGIAPVVAVTTGHRHKHLYARPDDEGLWWNPAGTSVGKWGFNCSVTPIFYYGEDPHRFKGRLPSSPVGINASRDRVDWHPCPKPLSFTTWLVKRISRPGDTILDPFMGSGTTAIACALTGRNFIGIEMSKTYVEKAHERLKKIIQGDLLLLSDAQPLLFEEAV